MLCFLFRLRYPRGVLVYGSVSLRLLRHLIISMAIIPTFAGHSSRAASCGAVTLVRVILVHYEPSLQGTPICYSHSCQRWRYCPNGLCTCCQPESWLVLHLSHILLDSMLMRWLDATWTQDVSLGKRTQSSQLTAKATEWAMAIARQRANGLTMSNTSSAPSTA